MMMSDLEKDLKDFRFEDDVRLRSQCAKDLAAYITSLGYTRHGLTDAQREAVEIIRHVLEVYDGRLCSAEWVITKVRDGLLAFPSTPTPPEPPKPEPEPERKVVQVIYVDETINTNPGIYRLCDDGTLWWSNADGSDAKQIKPIPGDAA